ncbi:MAG: hypothetical protein AB1Z98_01790 [Nannocystaceae bacterium]
MSVRDANGEVPHRVDAAALELDRDPTPPLRLRYALGARSETDLSPVFMHPQGPRLYAQGRAWLALPTAWTDRFAFDLEVAVPSKEHEVATSFGLGEKVSVRATTQELTAMDLLAGDLNWARFSTDQGQDVAVALGPTNYDFRWIAAETAGVRTSIDAFFGAASSAPFTFLFVPVRRSYDQAMVRARQTSAASLTAYAQDFAQWDRAARMPIAHLLAHRWLGGMLRVVDERPEDGVWFSQGFSRYVAREVLFELGTLDEIEYLAELNELEAAAITSRWSGSPMDALVEAGTADAATVAAARGALYAARLDRALRERHQSLGGFLHGWLYEAQQQDSGGSIARGDFQARVERVVGPDAAQALETMVVEGSSLELPDDAYGPCFRRIKARYEGTAIGWASERFSGEPMLVPGLDPQGPAAAAGVRPSDRLEAVEYSPGEPFGTVRMDLRRGDDVVTVAYEARGKSAVGRGWVRRKGVAPDLCLERG